MGRKHTHRTWLCRGCRAPHCGVEREDRAPAAHLRVNAVLLRVVGRLRRADRPVRVRTDAGAGRCGVREGSRWQAVHHHRASFRDKHYATLAFSMPCTWIQGRGERDWYCHANGGAAGYCGCASVQYPSVAFDKIQAHPAPQPHRSI